MSRCLRFITILFVLCTGSLFANLHPCPGGWGVDVEFLYLFPTIDDTYFVIDGSESSDTPNGTRENNEFGFHPGFRVGGFYGFCECNRELQVYYTRLRATESRTVSGEFLSATVGNTELVSEFDDYAGTASSDLDLLYHRLDGLIVQQAWCWCGVDTYFHGGVEFAYIRLNENYAFVSPGDAEFGNMFQRSKIWGVGPQAGLEFDYRICDFSCCCPGTLSINFLSTGSILASKARSEILIAQGGEDTFDVTNAHIWRLIPAFHTRIGLNYAFCFSCINGALEIGYEFNTYLRAISRTIYPDDVAPRLSFSNYYNYDMQGLYVSLAVAF